MFAKMNRLTWKAGLLAVLKALLTFSIVLAASGSLDTTFSGDGKQNTDIDPAHPGLDNRAFAMALQPDGKIVAVGWSDDGTSHNFAVARYNTNGTLDPTFSGDGRLTTDLGGDDMALGVAIQTDGKIVVVGNRTIGSVTNVAVVRYTAAGALDPTFNGTGKRLVNWNGLSVGVGGGVAIQSDGKILVQVGAPNGTATDLGVFRFNPNGSLDTTFNGTGKRAVNFGIGISCAGGWGRTLALQKDGKIVMVGATNTGYFCVARLNSNGGNDLTFSGDGKQTTFFGANTAVWATALQPADGKIVVVGSQGPAGINYFAVARYNTDGTLDTTFNGTGKKLIGFSAAPDDTARSVAVQTNGKIVVCGIAAEIRGGDFALTRLNPNGSLDTTLTGTGGSGVAAYDFDNGGTDACRGISIDSSGRYVMAGLATVNGQGDFGVIRVLP